MDYQWDRSKATSNRRKHGVRFVDAITVFSDEYAITIEDDYPDEERFVTLGMDALGRILLVVYTYAEKPYGSFQRERQRRLKRNNTQVNNEDRI